MAFCLSAAFPISMAVSTSIPQMRNRNTVVVNKQSNLVIKNSGDSTGWRKPKPRTRKHGSDEEFMATRKAYTLGKPKSQVYLAFYSGTEDLITTTPWLMTRFNDDHGSHRGHEVFDTTAICDGYLYQLDQHLDRILASAKTAKVSLPYDREEIKSILIDTVRVSKCRDGSLRFWLSAGPGDYTISPSGCNPTLYTKVIGDILPPSYKPVKVITSKVPMKSPEFARTKSVNYLENVLCKMQAEEVNAYVSIWVDDNGFVAEGPNMNVAFITKENELVMPKFDKILSGVTAQRVLVLAESLVSEKKLSGIKVRDITVEEAKSANQMMLLGSGVLVTSVVQWDETIFSDGKEGPTTKALRDLIFEDMNTGPFRLLVNTYVT